VEDLPVPNNQILKDRDKILAGAWAFDLGEVMSDQILNAMSSTHIFAQSLP
jgi:hypothetical protein